MEWTRGCTVGRGSTATVYIATSCRSGDVFAVKSAELSKSEFLMGEQRILSTLKSCPQIVAYKGCDVTLENGTFLYNLFMEYAPHGTLSDIIRNGGLIEEALVRTYARQILLGLNHLHSNGVVHCDIKGQNLLLTDEGVKIADLGCARRVADSDGVIAGTPVFMGPEVARGEKQGFPADVWALGCTVLEMITGKAPWADVSDPVTALYRIGFSGEVPDIPCFVSEQGKDFLIKCLKRDPNERWSVGELLKHGFVQESKQEAGDLTRNLNTPTSVLDPSFWNSTSMEDSETIQSPTRIYSDSGRDRIHRLRGEATTPFGGMPNWEWDDSWVTVRSNNGEGHEAEGNMRQGDENREICEGGPHTDCIITFREDININVVISESDTSTSTGTTPGLSICNFSSDSNSNSSCNITQNCCNRHPLSDFSCMTMNNDIKEALLILKQRILFNLPFLFFSSIPNLVQIEMAHLCFPCLPI
ncbi:hypothetical protein L6164_032244 [Bauhinia variegata]|uniref:Uncharacterized protein n=1 Tax=Bauhinia variegata TaxID=167791 RepID=A0ACB9KN08_BAUVA|nr:hypothetical protein L6164_032244 [Bauhinia variegata]